MKTEPVVSLLKVLCLVCVLMLVGCTRTVTFYEGRRVPERELAILEYSFMTHVWIDQKPIASDLGGFTHNVCVKLLPKAYAIEWIEKSIDFTFVFHDSGTLHARPGRRYVIKTSYLPGQTRLTGSTFDEKRFQTEVLDAATWIEDADTHEVVVGTKPPWADTVTKRPRILGI